MRAGPDREQAFGMVDDTRGDAAPRDGWIDELVELHVLAENGDADARAAAQRWMSDDPAARRRWLDVDRACREVRESGPGVAP